MATNAYEFGPDLSLEGRHVRYRLWNSFSDVTLGQQRRSRQRLYYGSEKVKLIKAASKQHSSYSLL